jgi:hypothetical protein
MSLSGTVLTKDLPEVRKIGGECCGGSADILKKGPIYLKRLQLIKSESI